MNKIIKPGTKIILKSLKEILEQELDGVNDCFTDDFSQGILRIDEEKQTYYEVAEHIQYTDGQVDEIIVKTLDGSGGEKGEWGLPISWFILPVATGVYLAEVNQETNKLVFTLKSLQELCEMGAGSYDEYLATEDKEKFLEHLIIHCTNALIRSTHTEDGVERVEFSYMCLEKDFEETREKLSANFEARQLRRIVVLEEEIESIKESIKTFKAQPTPVG